MQNVETHTKGFVGGDFSKKIIDKYPDLRTSTNFTPIISTNRINSQNRWLKFIHSLPFMILKKEIHKTLAKRIKYWKPLKYTFNPLELSFQFKNFVNLFKISNQSIKELELKNNEVKSVSKGLNLIDPSLNSVNLPLTNEIIGKYDSLTYTPKKCFKIIFRLLKPTKFFYSKSGPIKYDKTDSNHINEKNPVFKAKINFLNQEYFMNLIQIDPLKIFKTKKTFNHFTEKSSFEGLNSLLYSDFPKKNRNIHFSDSNLIFTSSDKHIDFKTDEKKVLNVKESLTSIKGLFSALSYRSFLFSEETDKTSFIQSAKKINRDYTIYNEYELVNSPDNYVYPKIEHPKSVQTEVTKEKVIEKEDFQKTPQVPEIDLNRIVDQVYSSIEMKLKIEKERRGLFG